MEGWLTLTGNVQYFGIHCIVSVRYTRYVIPLPKYCTPLTTAVRANDFATAQVGSDHPILVQIEFKQAELCRDSKCWTWSVYIKSLECTNWAIPNSPSQHVIGTYPGGHAPTWQIIPSLRRFTSFTDCTTPHHSPPR